MSETDSFIEEVTEEVRRDRLFAIFRRYGWIAILLVLLIVGYAVWKEWSDAQARTDARAFGDQVTGALAADDPAGRVKALQAIHASGEKQAVLNLLVASDAVEAGDMKTAQAALQKVSGDNGLPDNFRELAQLREVVLAGDTMPADQKTSILEALAQAGKPYRPLAMEQLALMAAAKGDSAGAIKQFHAILQEPLVTPGLRRRATEMIVALGGDPAAS